MNVDITALLSGGAPTRTGKAKLTDEEFAHKLDDRLELIDLLFPGLEPQLQVVQIDVVQVDAHGMPLTVSAEPKTIGEQLPDSLLNTLMPVVTASTAVDENPRWQLQQMVSRQVLESAESHVTFGQGLVTAAGRVAEEKPAPVVSTKQNVYGYGNEQRPLQAMAAAEINSPERTVTLQPHEQRELIIPSSPGELVQPLNTRQELLPPQQTVSVRYPLNTAEWKQSVAQQIAVFSRDNLNSAEIRLHPEELGSLHISLRMQQERAHIHIVSEHSHVRQIMESAMPQLRAAMAESGIQLSESSVSAERPSSGGGEQEGGNAGGQHSSHGEESVLQEEEITQPLLTYTPEESYIINTFA